MYHGERLNGGTHLADTVLAARGGDPWTVGIVFYALDEKLRHGHGVWHLFVLAGSASHYLAILLYVA